MALGIVAAASPVPAHHGAQAPPPGPVAAQSGAVETIFTIFARGTQVGVERVAVSQTGEGWTIASSSRLEAPLNLTLRRAEARYDAAWRPRSLTMDGAFRETPIELRTTFSGTAASSQFLQDGQRREKTDTVAADTVILPNNFYGTYAVLARRLAAIQPGGEVRAYVAPQAEIAIRLDRVGTERLQTAGRSFVARRFFITFQNPATPLAGEVWAEEDGRLVRITIPAAEVDVVRADVASVAARRQLVHREGDEDVRVPTAGFTLAGTLSRPPATQAVPAGGRLPAIVLIAGSGPMDRDEVAFGIPIFGQLASALADAGFLVVRYDKRGVGQSGGRVESATLADYAVDARAVVQFLAKRKDVDPERIAMVGHSEGAWVGMLAASADKRVARLVAIAGAGTTGAQLVLEQQRHLLERMSLSDAERRERIEMQARIVAAVQGKGPWDGIPAEYRKQADTPWYASLLAFDPVRVMPRVRQPVLIVQAALDTQVPPHHGKVLEQIAASRKKDPGHALVTLEGLNHLLVPAMTGEVDEYGALGDRSVSPEVAKTIAAWLQK